MIFPAPKSALPWNPPVTMTLPAKSAAAYRKIWTSAGSPLLVHHLALAAALQAELGDTVKVVAAMRYGSPSITAGLQTLKAAGIDRILVLLVGAGLRLEGTGEPIELRAIGEPCALGGGAQRVVPRGEQPTPCHVGRPGQYMCSGPG